MKANSSRIASLPRWAQDHIRELEREIAEHKAKMQVLDGLVQCQSDGMSWTTVSNPAKSGRESLPLFSLHDGDAIRQVVLYEGDQLFVGRARQKRRSVEGLL